MAPANCTPTGVEFPLQPGWLAGRPAMASANYVPTGMQFPPQLGLQVGRSTGHGPTEPRANWRAIPAAARLASWPPWLQRIARQLAYNSRSSYAGWSAAITPVSCTPVPAPARLVGWPTDWRAIPAPARLAGWPPAGVQFRAQLGWHADRPTSHGPSELIGMQSPLQLSWPAG